MAVSTYMGIPGVSPYDLRGLSTEDKPTTNIPNGSTYTEIDTGKLYMFDAEGQQWYEW